MSYKNQIERLQEKLIREIKFAVEDAKGCIGTYYKNIGIRWLPGQSEKHYEELLAVNLRMQQNACTSECLMEEIFIQPQTGITMCRLNDEMGDDLETPLSDLSIESLEEVRDWLVQHNFITELPEQILHCGHCASTDVEILAFVKPNEDNEYANDFTQDNDEDDRYCNACQNHIELYTKPNLMELIDDWFARLEELPTLEKAAGLKSSDYDDRQAFLDACRMLWQRLPDDEKIERWRQRADDDPEQD